MLRPVAQARHPLEGIAMRPWTWDYRRVGRCALLVLALSALVAILPGAAKAAYPGANGKVAWVSNNGGADLEIMSSNYDGTAVTQLTTNTVDDKDPAWSPDGTKIAFARFDTGLGRFVLWTMNADGSGQALLAAFSQSVTQPTWSPDGSKIAVTRDTTATNHDIFVMNLSPPLSPSDVAATSADERDPAWSPADPAKILFSYSSGGGNYAL